MPYCTAINCSNVSDSNVSFFRFPLIKKNGSKMVHCDATQL